MRVYNFSNKIEARDVLNIPNISVAILHFALVKNAYSAIYNIYGYGSFRPVIVCVESISVRKATSNL